jgi:hypothetical protein
MAGVRYTIQQRVCLMQLYFKYESAGKCRRKFRHRFPGEPFPSRQSIHYLVSKPKTTASLLDKRPDRKRTVLTEDKLDDIGARLETLPIKYLKRVAQEASVLKTSARRPQNC